MGVLTNAVAFFRMLPEFFQVPGFWYAAVYLLLAEALLVAAVYCAFRVARRLWGPP